MSFQFKRAGQIVYPAKAADADAMFEAALDSGADNVESSGAGHEISCRPEDFAAVREALERRFGPPERAGLAWKPQATVALADEEPARNLLKLLDQLEDNEDVQSVSANFEIADALLSRLTA